MATFTSQRSGSWSVASDNIASPWHDAGVITALATVPRDDTDTVVIAAGHAVEFDVSHAAFTHGILGIEIQQSGKLYFKHSAAGTYHLMIKTGTHITGTISGSTRGELVASVDGTVGSTTAIPYDRKCIIDLKGTAELRATNLQCNLRPTEPTNTFVRCYGAVQTAAQATDINTTDDTITITSHGYAAGNVVRVASDDTLPGGLRSDIFYYVRSVTTHTFKLAESNADATIVDITSTGTGTLSVYTGWLLADAVTWGAGKDTPLVIEDVTADNWAVGDAVTLCNYVYQNNDQQRLTILAIAAGSIQLSAAVDSAHSPLALIVLVSRNVEIRSTQTTVAAQPIVVFGGNDTHGGRFGAIRKTDSVGTTFSGYGLSLGTNVTVSAIGWCDRGISGGSASTVTTVSGCSVCIVSTACTATLLAGAAYGIHSSTACTATTIAGVLYSISGSTGSVATSIVGGLTGVLNATNCYADLINFVNAGITGNGNDAGLIVGCITGISAGTHSLKGTILRSNTQDFSSIGTLIGYGCSLRSTVQNLNYKNARRDYIQQVVYDPVNSSDVLQKGRILAWCCGGTCTSDEATVPSSPPITLTWSHLFTFEAPATTGLVMPVWVDIPIRLKSGQKITIPVYLKLSATGFTEPGKVQIIDPNKGWDTAASKLFDQALTDTTDWQTINAHYTADYDKTVHLRVRAVNTAGTGTLHWWADPNVHPTLPAAEDVETAVSYGYTGDLLTGTLAAGGGGGRRSRARYHGV